MFSEFVGVSNCVLRFVELVLLSSRNVVIVERVLYISPYFKRRRMHDQIQNRSPQTHPQSVASQSEDLQSVASQSGDPSKCTKGPPPRLEFNQ